MAKTIASQDLKIRDLKNKLQDKEHELIMMKADLCRGCQYRNDYKNLFKIYRVKEQECEELHERVASIIYYLTGGRLSYSTYTLEACAEAYSDQLKIDVERATKELEEENEELKKQLEEYQQQEPTIVNTIGNLQLQVKAWIEQSQKYKQALDEIAEIANKQRKFDLTGKTPLTPVINEVGEDFIDILDIINKAKETK